MQSLKKLSFLFLLSTFILLLAACSDEDGTDSTAKETNTDSGKKDVLVVGSSGIYPPFISVDEDGKAQGYDVEVLEKVGEALGYEIKWEFAEFSGIFGMLDLWKN